MAVRRQLLDERASAPLTPFPRHWAGGLCCALTVVVALLASVGRAAGETPHRSAARSPKSEALRAIPWRQLDPRDRQNVRRVVDNVTIYHRLPTRVIDCDPDLFAFFQQHPEVIVETWRLMGISRVTLKQIAPGSYRADDAAGTTGRLKIVHAKWGADATSLLVVHADGAYEGPPFPGPVRAGSVLVMRSAAFQENNGRNYVTVQLDSFIAIQRLDVELLAKTVRPWVNKTADHNFIETLTFVSQYSRAAEKNPRAMELLAGRLSGLDPATRAQFVALCQQTAHRYAAVNSTNVRIAQHEAP